MHHMNIWIPVNHSSQIENIDSSPRDTLTPMMEKLLCCFCITAGPGAMHDVNGAAVLPRCSICLLVTVILLHLLKFWGEMWQPSSFSQQRQEQTISPIRRMETRERQWSTFSFLSVSFWLCIRVCSLLVRQEWEASIQGREKFESCTNLMMVQLLSLCLPNLFVCEKGKKIYIHVTVDSWLFIAQYWSVHSDYYYCVTSCSISV